MSRAGTPNLYRGARYNRSAPDSHYLPRSQSMKPIDVTDRERYERAETGSRMLLEAIRRYFLKGGRG